MFNKKIKVKKMKKILILSLYPAPYRAELYEYFAQNFDKIVFFERINELLK